MSNIKELEEAFEEVLNNSNESPEFKRRFAKLISEAVENANKNIYSNDDLKEIINLIELRGNISNEYKDIDIKI